MKYLNDFHKKTTEQALENLKKRKSNPNRKINYEEELKRHEEMHERENAKELLINRGARLEKRN